MDVQRRPSGTVATDALASCTVAPVVPTASSTLLYSCAAKLCIALWSFAGFSYYNATTARRRLSTETLIPRSLLFATVLDT